jgi:hypothetical protein
VAVHKDLEEVVETEVQVDLHSPQQLMVAVEEAAEVPVPEVVMVCLVQTYHLVHFEPVQAERVVPVSLGHLQDWYTDLVVEEHKLLHLQMDQRHREAEPHLVLAELVVVQ